MSDDDDFVYAYRVRLHEYFKAVWAKQPDEALMPVVSALTRDWKRLPWWERARLRWGFWRMRVVVAMPERLKLPVLRVLIYETWGTDA